MTRQHTEEYKISAVKYYNNNDTYYKNVCNMFHCSLRSLKRWNRIYDETGYLKRRQRHGEPYKVTDIQVNFISKELKNLPSMSITNLHTKMSEQFPDKVINRQYIHEIIKKNHISRTESKFQNYQKINFSIKRFVISFD